MRGIWHRLAHRLILGLLLIAVLALIWYGLGQR